MRFMHEPRRGSEYQRLVCWAMCEDADGWSVVTEMFSSPSGALTACHGAAGFQSYVYDPARTDAESRTGTR